MPPRAIVARAPELDRLHGFLADADSRSLVLRGEPGIGKTLLWQAGVEDAVAQGRRVLAHRAVEAEAALAFTALADIVGPVLAEVGEELPAPRLRALRVALLLEDPGDQPPQPQAIGLALLDVLTALTTDNDIVLAIDDLQWLDSSSARALPLALRRLAGDRLKVLATVREAPGVQAPFELAALFGEERAEEIRLAALDLSALHRLLADRLAMELPRPDLVRIHELSGGNPMFALELGREVAQSGSLHVPASLREALDARLERLPDRTAAVLLAAAALARPMVDAVAPEPDAQAALEDGVAAGVVMLEGDLVRFTHPLLASRCYERASPWTRRAMHGALAEQVDDIEQRARHLALATEAADPGVAAELDAAAEHAAGRGAQAAAAELAELAAERTPPERPADRQRRRFAAAGFHHFAGDFGRASVLYDELAEELPAGPARADVLYLNAIVGHADLPTRRRLLERALGEASGDDARSAQILCYLAIVRWVLGDLPAGLRDARAGLARAERLGDPWALSVALGRVGLLETWALEITPGLLERGVEIERCLEQPAMFLDSPAFMLSQRLYETDELDRSRELFEELDAAAAERGDEHTHQWIALPLMIVEWYAGRWRVALEHAAAAREFAEQTGEVQYRGMVEHVASRVEADLGLAEQARRSAEWGLRSSQTAGDEVFTIANLAALGHIELVRGDLRAAARYLRDLPERQLRTGHRGSLISPWADTIETLVGLGELEHARALLTRYEEIAAASNRQARVGATRCAGLLAAAEGDKDAALRALERALAVDGDPPMYPLERGQTLLALGAVQRQALQRRAARETLEQALAAFEALSARPWAEKTREELSRISGRSAASDELTKAERQVAQLAAEGRKNKEIAAAMFVTVGTVETHLSRVYRKLGVRSRAELAGRFTRDGVAQRGDRTPQT